MIEFIIGSYLMVSAVISSAIAKRKNRSTNNWYTIGMISGLIGVVVLLFMPRLNSEN